jgi:hypothetical protein
MNKKRFHFREALAFAYSITCKFPLQILLPILIYVIFMVPFLYFDMKLFSQFLVNHDIVAFLVGMMILYAVLFVFIVYQFVLLSGYIRITAKWLDEKVKPTWKDYFPIDFELFGKFLAVSLIYGLLTEIGIFLFIVPGFIMLVLYYLSPIILIHRHGGVRRAFGISDKLVSGVMWQTLIFILISTLIISGPSTYFLINYFMLQKVNLMLPVILFGILTFSLNTLIQLSYIYLYKDLSAQQEEIDLSKIKN